MCQHFSFSPEGWSGKGCLTRIINSSLTECLCNHLTHFAVLMDYADSVDSGDGGYGGYGGDSGDSGESADAAASGDYRVSLISLWEIESEHDVAVLY